MGRAMSKPLDTEKILADAEVAAVYLRALLDKGVPMQAAISLTGNYALANRISDASKEEPKPPWEQGR
jgi:hypothetical protein